MIDTTTLAAAAAAAHTASLQGHILGELGASGAALASTVVLVAGVKGKHKIKLHHQHHIAVVGLVTGTLYSAAAGIWTAPASITAGVTQALQGAPGGTVGLGAVALMLCAALYGFKLRPFWAATFGIGAASVFAAAGGIWSLGSSILASGVNQLLGV
jgi:hypothetical protein